MAADTSETTVTVVDRTTVDTDSETPVGFGTDELFDAVEAAGGDVERVDYWTETDAAEYLVVGTTEDQVVERLLADAGDAGDGTVDGADGTVDGIDETADALDEPEAVVYRTAVTDSGTAQVVAGSDDRGLMYALLELADRVEADGLAALDEIDDAVETPDNEVRGVDRFLMGPMEDEWFYDEDFWHYYLARLARCRFNRFVLTTGHDTAFMSPPYPFFVEVPGYSDVRVTDRIETSREDHLALLRRIGELCHAYGLEFVFSTWQQRPRSANRDMKDDGVDQGLLVEGLPFDDDEAFTEYCTRGLEEVLVAAPEIDAVQLRVNFESGVGDRSTAEQFWRELTTAPASAGERRGDDVDLDIRAKGCTDNMIQWAQETGVDLTISTKYWCESTGLPYHNTQMRRGELANLDDMNRARRYSYSDMLEKPRFFDVLYRLWVVGTNRIFLSGDPDFARRFSANASFGDGKGFEILSPLGLKGGHYEIQEAWPLFDDPDLRDYEWEDERYWAWYLTFGRLGYSTETDADVWERAFAARFGAAASAVEDAYAAASKVLPLLTAAHLTQHPTLHNWAELDTGGALFVEHNYNPRFTDVTYASAEPSDPAMFDRIDEFVEGYLDGEHPSTYTPIQVARWYDHLAETARAAIEDAETALAEESGGEVAVEETAEFRGTALDVRMLADLAEYHAEKTRAATALACYEADGDLTDLRDAYAYMRSAVDSWTALADRGGEAYHDDMLFAMGPPSADEGTWADRIDVEMDPDLEKLATLLDDEGAEPPSEPTGEGRVAELSTGETATLPTTTGEVVVPIEHAAGESLDVVFEPGPLSGLADVTLHYRHTNQLEGAFETVPMESTDSGYHATVPDEYVTPEWDLLVYVTAVDQSGNGVVAPGLFHPSAEAPYHTVTIR